MFWEWFENLCQITFGTLKEAEDSANDLTNYLYEIAVIYLAYEVF